MRRRDLLFASGALLAAPFAHAQQPVRVHRVGWLGAWLRPSEGERDAAVNIAEGQKQQVIKASEAKKQQQINEAEGAASAILAIAGATAEGIRRVAESIGIPGGYEAVQLRVAEQYLTKFGELANASDSTLIVPANVADAASVVATAMNIIKRQAGPGGQETQPPSVFSRQG